MNNPMQRWDFNILKNSRTPTVFELEKLYNQIFINPIPQKITEIAPNWSGDFIIKTDKAWLMYIEQNEFICISAK